ncbi:MAG: Crp/Fnr family transcriptional regulator [Zoogloea sp.]|nr:Crp/Fnr family transcriptional regulator [Zoogloea sp.]
MQNEGSDLLCEIRKMSLFEGLDAALLAGIAHASIFRHAKKGARLYWQGDRPQAFYYVISGHIRRAISSAEGDEKVIDIVSPGQSFALAELFGEAPYESFAEAVEPAVLLQIGKEGVTGAIAASGVLALRILALVAEKQAAFERHVAACFFQSGCRRLLDYLLHKAGPNLAPQGDTVVELQVSKRVIAASIGVTAETLSRSLRELSDAGLIAVRGKKVHLLQKLAARIRAGSESEIGGRIEPHERRRADIRVEHPRPAASTAWI